MIQPAIRITRRYFAEKIDVASENPDSQTNRQSVLHPCGKSDDTFRDDYGYVARNSGFDRDAPSRRSDARESRTH